METLVKKRSPLRKPISHPVPHWRYYGMRLSIVTIFLMVLSLLSGTAYAETGIATFYTEKSCQAEGNSGKLTASGEVFNEKAMTCALPHLGFGKEYMVYNPDTDKTVVVRHNDFGPGRGPRRKGVVIDLTPAAFKSLGGELKNGKINVSYMEIK